MSGFRSRRRRRRRAKPEAARTRYGILLALLPLLLTEPAAASSTAQDGVYGRLAGELDWSFKLGAAAHPAGVSPSLGTSLHYYSLFGLTVDVGPMGSESGRSTHTQLAAGAELRPLFLPRWLLGWQQGPALWDLAIDSLSLGLGSYVSMPREEPARVGLWASLGMGVPLTSSSKGPWLELKAFRRVPDPSASTAPAHGGFLLYLSYHGFARITR